MKTVWKFPFEIHDAFVMSMPRGAVITLVDCQGRQPTLWAVCDASEPNEMRRFVLVGTGCPFNEQGLKFVATFQQPPYVWHLMEAVA